MERSTGSIRQGRRVPQEGLTLRCLAFTGTYAAMVASRFNAAMRRLDSHLPKRSVIAVLQTEPMTDSDTWLTLTLVVDVPGRTAAFIDRHYDQLVTDAAAIAGSGIEGDAS